MALSAAAKTTVARGAQAAAAAAIKNALSTDGKDPWDGINIGIKHKGAEIILPDTPIPMTLRVAIETLTRKEEEDEQEVAINETVDAYPKDGAVAFHKAMQRMFGWASAVPTPGFWGPQPPQTIDVEIGPHERISVVWGRFELPGVEGHVECGAYATPKGPRFRITGMVTRKHHAVIRELAETTRQIASEESIYKNKAIQLEVSESGEIDWYKAMLRPGRLDAVITITPPDAQAVKRLIRMYGRSMVDQNDELPKSAEALSGQIPAMIRECIERAKLYAIGRTESDIGLQVTDDDVFAAADGMKPHMDLLDGKIEERRDPSFKEMLKDASLSGFAEVLELMNEVNSTVDGTRRAVSEVHSEVQQLGGGRSAILRQLVKLFEDMEVRMKQARR